MVGVYTHTPQPSQVQFLRTASYGIQNCIIQQEQLIKPYIMFLVEPKQVQCQLLPRCCMHCPIDNPLQTNSMSKDNIDELGLLIHHNKRQGLLVLQKTREKKLTLFVLFVFFCFFCHLLFPSMHQQYWICKEMGWRSASGFRNHKDIYESWRKTIIQATVSNKNCRS